MNLPLVSVIIATYNASHLLRYAIASVLLSDFKDFEIIVVGDHCTDDTEAVVASFADARIRFVNLERNSGQQATPNNIGVGMARGEYLAFLNDDDMYLPHHLSSGLAAIRRTGADIVCSAHPEILPAPRGAVPDAPIDAIGNGFERTGSYSPWTFHVASSWILRLDAARKVGSWSLENRVWVTPSQDWLFRAWRAGMRIHCVREMSVVVLFRGSRRDVYRHRDSAEHETIFREVVQTGRQRTQVLRAAASWLDARLHRAQTPDEPEGWFDAIVLRRQWVRPRKLKMRLYERGARLLECAHILLGLHPRTLDAIRESGRRRGAVIREHRRFTGLAGSES